MRIQIIPNLMVSIFVLILATTEAWADRRWDAVYDRRVARGDAAVYFRCDPENQKMKIFIGRTTTNGEPLDAFLNDQNLQLATTSLIECMADDFEVRVKFSSNRFEGHGCGGSWNAVSVWVNRQKILREFYLKCMLVEYGEYSAPRFLRTEIDVYRWGAKFCQQRSECRNLVAERKNWDGEEYGNGLFTVQQSFGYMMVILDEAEKDLCFRFYEKAYLKDRELPHSEVVRQESYSATRSYPAVEFFNLDLNGDGKDELVSRIWEVAAHWTWDRHIIFREGIDLSREAIEKVAEHYLKCVPRESSSGDHCSAREPMVAAVRYGGEKDGPFPLNNPTSSILREKGRVLVETRDVHNDEIVLSAVNKDFTPRGLCRFYRVHPNF